MSVDPHVKVGLLLTEYMKGPRHLNCPKLPRSYISLLFRAQSSLAGSLCVDSRL